jgi:DNA-binding transcriptional LysR family regulator
MVPRWDDIRLLLAVASEGSYARAAQREGISLATIGRRLRALEQDLGATLIERRPDGHRLTAQAETLLPAATRMAAAAGDLRASADPGHTEVRVLAREWEALFLIRQMPALRTMLPHVAISLGYKHWPDLTRWEAELVLSDHVPTDGNIIARPLGRVGFAAYASQALAASLRLPLTEDTYATQQWIGFTPAHRYFASEQWLARRGQDSTPSAHRFDTAFLVLEAIRSGVGTGLLPVWLGDSDPTLVRVSNVLPDLTHQTHALINADLRHEARLQALLQAITLLFRQQRTTLGGERAPPGDHPLG